MMNKKRGLNKFSKQPDDGDPWAPNNFRSKRKTKTPVEPRWASQQKLRSQPTKLNSCKSGPS